MAQEGHIDKTSSGSNLFLFVAILIFAVALATYYATANQFPEVWRMVALVGVGVGCLAISYLSPVGKRVLHSIGEARTEVRKVIWPTRQESMQMTLIVFVIVFLMGLFLWGVDSLFLWLIELII